MNAKKEYILNVYAVGYPVLELLLSIIMLFLMMMIVYSLEIDWDKYPLVTFGAFALIVVVDYFVLCYCNKFFKDVYSVEINEDSLRIEFNKIKSSILFSSEARNIDLKSVCSIKERCLGARGGSLVTYCIFKYRDGRKEVYAFNEYLTSDDHCLFLYEMYDVINRYNETVTGKERIAIRPKEKGYNFVAIFAVLLFCYMLYYLYTSKIDVLYLIVLIVIWIVLWLIYLALRNSK